MNGCPRFLFSKKREKLLGLVSKTGKIISSLYSFIIIVLINITIIMIMIFLRWLNWFDVHNCEHNLSWNLYCRILLILPWPTHGDDDDFDYYSVDNFDDDDFYDNLDDNFHYFDDDDLIIIFFSGRCARLQWDCWPWVQSWWLQGQWYKVKILWFWLWWSSLWWWWWLG